MNIQEVLMRARDRVKPNSEREFARHIRVDPASLLRYGLAHHLPSDEAMVRISDAAGIAPEEGLVLLNMWRSEGEVAAIYGRIHKELTKKRASKAREQGKRTENRY